MFTVGFGGGHGFEGNLVYSESVCVKQSEPKLDLVIQACNPAIWEAETRGSQGQSQLDLENDFKISLNVLTGWLCQPPDLAF